ncbi:benzoate 4-monooxygenase [Fusarium albosuccineum]|uniref:Benzoate 4-monooxygenase n=1 Tax=Fusarium albosuccineum TaxID=1237068 RepID=A0A8H4LPB7_9HYPO|nr:benzoate 4-monooxygenase [Fusarium albosuccineum]
MNLNSIEPPPIEFKSFQHTNLPFPSCIRLLSFVKRPRQMSPTSIMGTPLIECYLEPVNINSAPEYDVISSAWGNPRQPTPGDIDQYGTMHQYPIAVNGRIMFVPRNIYEALKMAKEVSDPVERRDELGKTELIRAAQENRIGAVRECLKQNAWIHAQDNFGETAMHYAAENGLLNIVEVLLNHGASMGIVDSHGRTPLDCCSLWNHKQWNLAEELSYEWSKSPEDRELVPALECIRVGRPIWIDAVCVNQSNPDEQTSHAAMMSQIYGGAQSIVAWLGVSDDDTRIARNALTALVGSTDDDAMSEDDGWLSESDRSRQDSVVFDLLERSWFERPCLFQESLGSLLYVNPRLEGADPGAMRRQHRSTLVGTTPGNLALPHSHLRPIRASPLTPFEQIQLDAVTTFGSEQSPTHFISPSGDRYLPVGFPTRRSPHQSLGHLPERIRVRSSFESFDAFLYQRWQTKPLDCLLFRRRKLRLMVVDETRPNMLNHVVLPAHLAATIPKLCLGGLAFLVVQFLLSTLYYLLFHPLRKFPGPPLARVSRLWSRIGNFKGRKSERIHEAHLKYGPIVRVGPNELSFADPGAVREIYNSDVFIKEETFYRAKRIFHEDFLLSYRDPEAHKQRRKLLSRGFSQAAMLDFEPHVNTKITAMLDHWAEKAAPGQALDVYSWVHWLGFDIVYHLMFDEDPGSVKYGRPHEVMPYFRAWKPTYIYYAMKIIENCRVSEVNTPFLRQVLHGAKDGYLGRALTNSEIAEECMGGMFGGSGTTANTFVYILWGCLQKPEVAKALREELVAAFPDRDTIPDHRACSGLPLLQAVINETLRRYPTIIATLPRAATKDAVVRGVAIPKGTIVGVQNYTMHRNETAFPNSEEWDPQRWLTKEGEELRKEAWVPFSVGLRKCVGINLAQMELNKITAAFFRRFEASIDPSMREEDMRMFDTFNASPAGAKLLLRLKELPS